MARELIRPTLETPATPRSLQRPVLIRLAISVLLSFWAKAQLVRFPTPLISQIALVLSLVLVSVSTYAQNRNLTPDHRLHQNIRSQFGPKTRDLIVWLPPGYANETQRRYPTLYMHDGDSVFVNWRLDETAIALITNKQIEPMIIVHVPNGGTVDLRFEDYTPTHDPAYRLSGKGDNYGRMLVEEVKPFIDSNYRTLPEAANTGLGGASLGGLATLYLGLKHPEAFGRLAVLSPSVWWDGGMILREVQNLKTKPPLRIWLDVGTDEDFGRTKVTKQLRDALTNKGWVLDKDLIYYEAKGAKHEEAAFARRASLFLKFLFPPKSE